MPQRNMIGKYYHHRKFGIVEVITQPSYIKGAPRNVIIESEDGTRNVVPQRSLRKIKGGKKTMKLPDIRNRVEAVFINAAPDGGYALRILRYYRRKCDEYWVVKGLKESEMAIYTQMNKYQKERAKELDKAIEKLGNK